MSSIVPGGAILPGVYTIASLPTPDLDYRGKYAFVTDLGGGPDMAICDGTNWKHIRLGVPATMSNASGTVTLTPLVSAPISIMTGNILTSLTLSVASAGLYPGYMAYVRRPGLLVGALGIQLAAGGGSLPILGSSTSVFVYDGTQLQQVQ